MSKRIEDMTLEELYEHEKKEEVLFKKKSASLKYLRAIEYHSRNEFEKASELYREALELNTVNNSIYKCALDDAVNRKPYKQTHHYCESSGSKIKLRK